MTTNTAGPRVWISEDGDYIGIVGAHSVAQVARLIASQDGADSGVHDLIRQSPIAAKDDLDGRPIDPTDEDDVLGWLGRYVLDPSRSPSRCSRTRTGAMTK